MGKRVMEHYYLKRKLPCPDTPVACEGSDPLRSSTAVIFSTMRGVQWERQPIEAKP